VRTSFSGRHVARKAVGRSRDRGRKGHRILRRVLGGGRHLGFHGPSSFTRRRSRRPWRLPHAGKRERSKEPKLEGDAKALHHPADGEEATEVSEARSISWRRGKKTPTLALSRHTGDSAAKAKERGNMAARAQLRPAEAFTGVVKHPVPRQTARSPRLRGVSTR